ncbi:unnamed protein product [Microthlaspi erraticum]|uniref:Uncharacterized protein n=1 Tax=Microthlaspi erraticum TaxID=1685480 RepID=A0A6D2HH59_9BRAS|nr:unnamed protein product [Microthlaspi erraticum]
MSEEFEESDIIFSDQSTIPETNTRNEEKSTRRQKMVEKTSPVNIPAKQFGCKEWEMAEEEDKTPPHIIIERRMKEQIAFSVGTLKGRDLSRHRDSILKMTGFIEA